MAQKIKQLSNHLSDAIDSSATAAGFSATGSSTQNPDSIPWNPNNEIFPLRSELPKHIPYHPNAPEEAAWVWGEHDNIGRLNLLTPQRVANAARTQIRTGETVRLDLPIHIPSPPAFNRQTVQHRVIDLGGGVGFDDVVDNMNPQSGSQWDGFRHFSHLKSKLFYNGTKPEDILAQPDHNLKCSIHHWSSSSSSKDQNNNNQTESSSRNLRREGISGRAILLDYWTYAQSTPGKSYNPFQGHSITFSDLQQCAEYQGINLLPAHRGGDIQVGDILLIRSGWTVKYNSMTEEERQDAANRKVHVFAPPATEKKEDENEEEVLEYAGLAQEESILTWLHDSYFAAVAGDAPSFERWPSTQSGPAGDGVGGWLLHEFILSLWGIPLGEMWDLEGVAEICRREKRWTFFVTSAPDMVLGGVGSKPNATAIF